METQEQTSIASKLLNAVLIKTAAEILLVCVVVSLAAFNTAEEVEQLVRQMAG